MADHFKNAWNELTAPGAQFEMIDTEVLGVPMRVFKNAPSSMRELWELATLYGDRTYLVFEDERLSYAETDAQVRALAQQLCQVHGVGPGDRVAVSMRNYPEWVISYWAIVSIGAAVVGMNAWWTSAEMRYGLEDSRPKVLIADAERVERVVGVLDELRSATPLHLITVRYDGDLPSDASRWSDVIVPETAPEALPAAEIDPDDDACVFYTSGTTGFPKGAQLTHRSSVHNVLHIAFLQLVAAAAAAAEDPASVPDPDAVPVVMAPTPLFHVTACNCLLHPATIAGATLVLLYRWDPARALELIERERVSGFSGVPTMGRELISHPDWERRDTSSLLGISGGGAPVQPDLVDKIAKSLKGGNPGQGYGLTETSGIITATSGARYTAKPTSAGPIVPTVDTKLVDELGEELPPGSVGQLCVRGPIVIKGYVNQPEATSAVIQDGWFNTGDIARIDEDGYLHILDRAKDVIIRGGENIACSEVEAALYEHPAVAEAAVFGIPDERLGEAVAAAIVVKHGETLDDATMSTFVAERIARHKVPATYWFRNAPLPRNASGKFLKKELREQLAAG